MPTVTRRQTTYAPTKEDEKLAKTWKTRSAKLNSTPPGADRKERLDSGRIARSKAVNEEKVDRLIEVISKSDVDPKIVNSSQVKKGMDKIGDTAATIITKSRYALRSNPFSLNDEPAPLMSRSSKRKRPISSDNTTPPPQQILLECIACSDAIPEQNAIEIDCGHTYCRSCLRTLMVLTLKDEATFPPRCCHTATGKIPDEVIRAVLSLGEIRSFRLSEHEFSTPGADRMYCPKESCGRFIKLPPGIKPGMTWGSVRCSRCRTRVCFGCKGHFHLDGRDCVNAGDDELDKVFKIAEEGKWKRCYKCFEMVERSSGCNHMVCRCGANFCYACGEKYGKGCKCSEDEGDEGW